ncbi:hypothetical protein RIF29_23378 [Crotalaria pallida]|uniref:Uncharacterized protein n=1 Tax=Crotalaria pallida TaxID=3830 RepID=A0AAN9F865_CROPI
MLSIARKPPFDNNLPSKSPPGGFKAVLFAAKATIAATTSSTVCLLGPAFWFASARAGAGISIPSPPQGRGWVESMLREEEEEE